LEVNTEQLLRLSLWLLRFRFTCFRVLFPSVLTVVLFVFSFGLFLLFCNSCVAFGYHYLEFFYLLIFACTVLQKLKYELGNDYLAEDPPQLDKN